MRKLRPTPAGVIASVALAISLGGNAFAATMLIPRNSVGSPQVINGSLQKGDLSGKAIAALHGATGARGPQGAQGPTGPQGMQGVPGPPATALWAWVDIDGNLLSSGGHVTSTAKTGTPGGYEVIFDRDVSNCAIISGLDGLHGQIYASRRFPSVSNGAFVFEQDSTGTGTWGSNFYLAVFC